MPILTLLDDDPALLLYSHLRRQCQDALGGLGVAYPCCVDVRDEVALSVGVARTRTPGEIGRQALCRCQSGPLADQQHDDLRIEQRADVVEDADATVTDEEDRPLTPAPARCSLAQQREKCRHLG